MKGIFAAIAMMLLASSTASPPIQCPEWVSVNGIVKDLLLLSDTVSINNHNDVNGTCDTYKMEYEIEGWYDTRMRIYNSYHHDHSFIVFRPTQQTKEGEAIHEYRKMVDCVFLNGRCAGQVHDRFQQAFLSLVSIPSSDKPWNEHLKKKVFVGGHSLGGALQIFMALTLWKVYNIIPNMTFGFAGPFIGDRLFYEVYQRKFVNIMDQRWWQVETVDKNNPGNFDGTVEGYQVNEKDLYIDTGIICGFMINPLPIPQQAYGMHDIKQYSVYLQGNSNTCFP